MAAKPRKDLKFHGWDWTELLAIWPESRRVEWPKDTKANHYKEEAQANWILHRLDEMYALEYPTLGGEATPETKWRYRQVRRFAKKCAASSHHTGRGIMKAIANEKDLTAFLGWFSMSLRAWWT